MNNVVKKNLQSKFKRTTLTSMLQIANRKEEDNLTNNLTILLTILDEDTVQLR